MYVLDLQSSNGIAFFMEIIMADQKVQAPNELAQLQGILGLLGGGGQTQTVTPTNTAPLQGVLSNLQGVDYNPMLQSIFQQAADQIPGMQSAYGRAVGARSSGNAPMQAALQELLKQTTLAGQQQIATQQNQNLQTQTQAATALKGTQQKTAQQSQLGQLAAILGLAQAATKLGGYKTVQEMIGDLTGTGTSASATAAPTPSLDTAPAGTANMSMTPDMGFNLAAEVAKMGPSPAPTDTTAEVPTVDLTDYSQPYGMSYAPADFIPQFNISDLIAPTEPAAGMSMAPEEWFQSPDIMSYF